MVAKSAAACFARSHASSEEKGRPNVFHCPIGALGSKCPPCPTGGSMSIQNVLRLLQPTEHMVRANASAAAWRGFIRRISITTAGRCRQRESRRSKIAIPSRKTRSPKRSGFHIPSVRNPVAESTVCGRLRLDLDGSIRAAKRDLEKPRRTGGVWLAPVTPVGYLEAARPLACILRRPVGARSIGSRSRLVPLGTKEVKI